MTDRNVDAKIEEFRNSTSDQASGFIMGYLNFVVDLRIGGAIARAGIVKLDPLIGFQLSVDLLEVAGNILKGVAPPFGAVGGFLLDAANEFERVRHLTSEKEKLKLIEGPKSRNKFRVAAYCYLAVRVDIGGGYKFADTDLFDENNGEVSMGAMK